MPTPHKPRLHHLVCLTLTVAAAPGASAADDSVLECRQQQESKRLNNLKLSDNKHGVTTGEDDGLVHISADHFSSQLNASSVFTGNVEMRRNEMSIFADEILYDQKENRIDAKGNVSLGNETGDIVYAPTLHYGFNSETGYTGMSRYSLADDSGRGDAERINFMADNKLVLENMHFTTCPPGRNDWMLSGSRLTLDREKEVGTALNVTVQFMHVPVFYAPYFSFPLGENRKTGFLAPHIGHSDKRGMFLVAPYYINLAPNYDDTLTARYMSRRGLQLQNEFRYLGKTFGSDFELEYMPNDADYNDSRSAAKLRHNQSLSPHWSASTDLQWVSDTSYLVDLGDSIAATSATHLPRTTQISYNDNTWQFAARALNYQTIDKSIAPLDRPYSRAPQITLSTDTPGGFNRPHFQLDSEWVNFSRNAGVSGQRLDAYPSISLPLRNAYAFFVPKAGYRYTAYDLTGAPDETPERGLPVYSLDSGLIFERDSAWRGNGYIQTLEPRLFYLHVPYQDQDSLPIFDTGIPDFSFYNLFRDNRFVGADRVGDADQATLAISSRFLDAQTGIEQIRLSLGQTFYFHDPQVALPASRPAQESSNLVAEIQARIGQDWYLRGNLQWNSKESDTERGSSVIQYRPAANKIVTLGHRYNKDLQEQVDFSAQWPLTARWTVLTRWNYAMPEERTIQKYTGFEYNSCCWAFRITKGERILADGSIDSPVLFELELTGLARLGPRPESPMKEGKFIFE